MLNKMIAATAVTVALMFSGCGDSAGEDALAVQNSIDTGDASAAIDLLESKANRTDDENALLAEAYASNAGYSMIDITIAFIDAGESNTTSGEDITDLVISLINKSDDKNASINDLNKSITYYESIPNRTDDQNFKLSMTYIVQLSLMVDNNSSSTSIVSVATNAFDTLGAVIPADDPDLQDSYTQLQAEISSGGAITTGEIDNLKADYQTYLSTL